MAALAKAGRVLLILACLALLTSTAQAGERIWAALFVAQNWYTPGPHAQPQLADRLHQVFGFSHYRLLKEETIDLSRDWDHWVLSRKDFFLRLQPLPPNGGPTRLRYEIYKDDFLIASGVYEVVPDTPLFISGPDLQRGRLIFVLQPR